MRQIAVLMRTPDHHHHLQHRQQRLPPSLRMRCSPQDCSSAVLTAAAPSSTNPSTAWGEGPDPVTIYLPGADGTAESSPADPASAGLPNTPTGNLQLGMLPFLPSCPDLIATTTMHGIERQR